MSREKIRTREVVETLAFVFAAYGWDQLRHWVVGIAVIAILAWANGMIPT